MGRGGRPEAVPLWATPRHPTRATRGGRIARVQTAMGGAPMPWQRALYDVAAEIDPATGFPWYREIIVLVVRQAGKTTVVRAVLTDRCLFQERASVRYTAQNRNMALERLEHDFWSPISASPLGRLLNDRVGRRAGKPGFNASTGSEYVAWKNHSRLSIDSVKKTSGHGPTLHLGAIDEAFAHPDGQVEAAMRPAMITVPDAQLWVTSAAGDSTSKYLRTKADAARDRLSVDLTRPVHQRRSRIAFLEFAAPRDADRADPATWWATHPALGYTITESAIAADFDGMEATEFDRAYLGWWLERKAPEWVIPRATWTSLGLPLDVEAWRGEPVWSVDTSPQREFTSIGMAGEAMEGRVFVDVIERRAGVPGWAVPRLEELRRQWGGSHVGLIDAARSLAPDLEDAGFTVHRLSAQDRVDACGAFYDDAMDTKLSHVNDPNLDDALAAAVRRTATQEGGFVWARNRSMRDITPLYAATVARFVWRIVHAGDYDIADSAF